MRSAIRSIVLCYAPPDRKIAQDLGLYLERNIALHVSLGEGLITPGYDIVDAAERALSADAAFVLLSPDSVPRQWNREKWEPVFISQANELKTPLAFALLGNCRFPDLLRRQAFFDLSHDFLAGARNIRQWLLRPGLNRRKEEPPVPDAIETLRCLLADAPACAEDLSLDSALRFVHACAHDFEAVHRIDCRNRTRAGILGHMGYTLGLRLAGTADENLGALREHCVQHRYLLIFENLDCRDRTFAAMGGRASFIFTPFSAPPERVSLDDIGAAFFTTPRDESQCAPLLGDAFQHMLDLLGGDFEAGLRLGWALVSMLKSASRFAEAIETLNSMEQASRAQGDALALFRIEWEQSWLRDDSGADGTICILPTAAPETAQLELNFA